MPKTKFQSLIFTLLMVVFMLFAMISYNIALASSSFSLNIFKLAIMQLPLFIPIAFIIDYFFVAKIVRLIASKIAKNSSKPIVFILAMSTFTILFMCPIMSGIATALFSESNFYSHWLETTMFNFPFAFCVQLLLVGPIVRFIFVQIFKEKTT